MNDSSENKDLEGKGLTPHDVIRQALQCENLGPDADAAAIRKWADWKFPLVRLPEDLDREIEKIRNEEAA